MTNPSVCHRRRRSRVRDASRHGMTLFEVLIAVIMLAVAVGGLLGSSASVARQMGGGNTQTVAASLAQARLDSLTSLSCAQLDAGASSGSTLQRGVRESWTVTDGRNVKTIDVRIRIPRRSNELRYQMVIPCRD
ncbi:prepilin-type N-terminal cleavage/methylation domain-containing protein [Gemmatimonas sp.]|jgi:prepilin-type N-terminal cleavage/methylation domain-containing protein|uniref:type IV pilus modification PilV family protein n=1 Tax=Gemmatimonas sp. TaxID=1962908 RepID=UPI0037C1361B